jgi:hypothetical protein
MTARSPLIRACAVAALFAGSLLAPAAARAASQSHVLPPASCGNWRYDSTAARGDASVLTGVGADSATTAWAVGNWYDAGTDVYHAFVVRQVAGYWTPAPADDPGDSRNVLQGITVSGDGDAWAVGFSQDAGGGFRTLVERPEGGGWHAVGSPSPGDQESVLWAVASVNSADAWAVGYQQDAGGPRRTLIERWTGTRWKVVPSPSVGTDDNLLYGVAAVAPDDVWAVGVSSVPWFQTLTLHWNGSKWKVVKSPNVGDGNNFLYSVASAGDGTLMAVGSSLTDTGTATLAMRWDGSKWHVTPTPSPDQGFDELLAVAAAGPDDVWAVGHRQGTAEPFRTLAEHWDGTAWKLRDSANRGPRANQLFGLTIRPGAARAWAVGSFNASSGQDRGLIEVRACTG